MKDLKNSRFGGESGTAFRQISLRCPLDSSEDRKTGRRFQRSNAVFRYRVVSTEMIFKTIRPDEITVLDSRA